LDDRRRDEGTNFILRIKEQETRLTLHEHDNDDDDDDDDPRIARYYFAFLFFLVNKILN